ncbi:MAG TPA: AbgT family transporter [Croceibacterium sp.]
MARATAGAEARKPGERFLDLVERLGNALPDPVAIFVIIIALLVAVSALGAALGWSAVNPVTGEALVAKSLLSEEMIRRVLGEMARTFTGFAPLGLVLTIMLGAGVAEKSGLLAALIRKAVRSLPDRLLTPAVLLFGMLSIHAMDSGYLVYVPLAGVVFANAGRNPVLGVVLAFVGCGTGLAGNLLPGQYDVLILGITQTGAAVIDPAWRMNPLGNWWFMLAIAVAFVGLGWLVATRVVGPRLDAWDGAQGLEGGVSGEMLEAEGKGLRAAGLAALAVVAAAAALALVPGYSPLYAPDAATTAERILPFYQAIPALLLALLLACGWAYGKAAGTIRSHRDVVTMMGKGLEGMAPYLVLVFFAAHFVAMFGWSNLAPITAINGATILRALDAPPALLLPLLTTASAWLDFLIASGSAKWTAVAPVAVPMLMLLGVSPEMATAAYRVGDTVTNLISPLNPYFVLVLLYCQRWNPKMRLGALLSATLPFAFAFYLAGAVITAGWVALDLPLGPGTSVAYHLPAAD